MSEMNRYVLHARLKTVEHLDQKRVVPIFAMPAHNEAEPALKTIEVARGLTLRTRFAKQRL